MTLAVLELPTQPESVDRCARALERRSEERVLRVDDPADVGEARQLCVPWIGRPRSLAPLAALRRARRGSAALATVDQTGEVRPFGITQWIVEGVRHALFRALDALLLAGAGLLRPGAAPAPRRPGGHTGAGLAVVLPILPDLSHTFVYREVARLRHHAPELDLLILERGIDAPLHPEAEALQRVAAEIPTRGVVGRFLTCLRWLCLEPVATRRLLAVYAREPEGWRALFGKLPLREPRHPGRAFELASALSRTTPGPIHVYGSTYAANVALGAALLLDRPFSVSSYVDFEFDYAFKMLRRKYDDARFFRVCTRFCAERLTDMLTGVESHRVPVIVWGLDVESWRRRAVPPAPELSSSGLVLFSAARLVAKKGLDRVPALLADLRDRGIDARWLVAGDGPERDTIERLVAEHAVAERVDWLGPLPNDRMIEKLAEADLAIMPCRMVEDGERDGIPVFLTEAMALGRVVLTTPVSGIPELIVDDDTGFLVPPDDRDALRDAVIRIVERPDRARTVAAHGRDVVLDTQDADRSARSLLARLRDEVTTP